MQNLEKEFHNRSRVVTDINWIEIPTRFMLGYITSSGGLPHWRRMKHWSYLRVSSLQWGKVLQESHH